MTGAETLTARRQGSRRAISSAWCDVAAVDSFAQCAPDTLFRVFPRLLPRNGVVPEAVKRHLTRWVAVRSLRLSDRSDRVRHGVRDRPDSNATDYAADLAITRSSREADSTHRDAECDAERAELAFVTSVLAEVDGAALRDFDSEDAAAFAHSTGVHPAYVWSEALLSHELFTAIGWLGHFQRRTPVTMPSDVVDYFADTILRGPDGVLVVREPLMAWHLSSMKAIEDVWEALRTRRAAFDPGRRDRAASLRNDQRSASGKLRPFTINGRFLTQPMTGVQRYAREIVTAMDGLLQGNDVRVSLTAPPGGEVSLCLQAIELERCGSIGGQIWEQTVFPAATRGPSLHLCNTAPAISHGHVVCLHDANVFIEPGSYSRAFRNYYRVLQPWVAKRAMKVVTVSRDAALQLARHIDIRTRDIEVLPNGHEHALLWDPARSRLSERWTPRRPFILLLASQARHKNMSRITGLAEAVDAMGLDLVLVGRQSSIFAEAGYGAASNLASLGAVEDDDLASLLSQALCLAFPSLTEGFGLPIVEAMAWNCPVVSSDRASLPEVCGDAALMANPQDDRLWLQHFSALAASRDLAHDLKARGCEQMKKFSWSASARGYLDLFAS